MSASPLAWLLLLVPLAGCALRAPAPSPSPPRPVFSQATYSSNLALDSTGDHLWVANTESGSVSLVSVEGDRLVKGAEIQVGTEPTCLALSPDDSTLYVTNRVNGTVAVINAGTLQVTANIPVGAEPIGCALTPFGDKLYVAVSLANTVAVIDTSKLSVASQIPVTNGFFPFAVAITNNDPAHVNEQVYVTQFYGQLPPGARPAATGDTDRGRVGKVSVLSTASTTMVTTILLAPHLTGFSADRSAFGGTTNTPTFAFPNLLNSVVVRGTRGYVVNGAESPDGPVAFQTNEQAFIHVFDTVSNSELSSAAINLNAAVKGERPKGVFLNTPWGLAIAPDGKSGLVLSAASDVAVRLTFSTDGAPGAVNTTGGVTRIPTGSNPRGVVINRTGTRAYVSNFISRDLTAINLTDGSVAGSVATAELPTSPLALSILHGEQLFDTSRGRSTVSSAPAGRMSTNGWGSCFSCHPFGWTDTVVWNFPDGPRKTPPLNGVFGHDPTGGQKLLNWSATRDEVEDFELNIRLVSSDRKADGSTGLFIGVPLSDIHPLVPKANAGRSPDWTDLRNYVQFGIRSPISPLRGTNVGPGRVPFAVAGCASCHAGQRWTSSFRNYTPPPATPPIIISNGQVVEALRSVGTFIPGEVTDSNQPAKGVDGFNPPSLLGFWAFPPFFHNGQAATLDEVLTRVLTTKAHKDAGISGRLDNPATRAALTMFLLSIDDAQVPEVAQ